MHHYLNCGVVELRQYTLHPGGRDVLIELFDREFVEPQESLGMRVIGQFRDLDDPDRFVWLRGFDDMASRGDALAAFYGGPVWRAHRAAANATMVDSDDVLLLRPCTVLPIPAEPRPPARTDRQSRSLVSVTVYPVRRSDGEEFARYFQTRFAPGLAAHTTLPVATLLTESAENTFPALSVRERENVFVSVAVFADPDTHARHIARLRTSASWQRELRELHTRLSGSPQELRLQPTSRSLLH